MTKVIAWCDICKKYVEVQEMTVCDEYYARTIYKLICGHTFKTQISVGETDVCHFEKLNTE
jgi:hypothetical protein